MSELHFNSVAIETGNYYARTDSGKNWRNKPFETVSDVLTAEHYNNAVGNEWARFLNARRSRGYHSAGYLVDRFTTVNPSGDEKRVYDYEFVTVPIRECGHRELWIMQHAKSASIETENGHELLTFSALDPDDENRRRRCVWDITTGAWVN